MSKFEVTLQVEVDDSGKPKITSSSVVPVTTKQDEPNKPRGKQPEPQPKQSAPTHTPRPAQVGNKASQGKSDWFQGTTWGQ